jgi:hypothetical protein
VWEELHADPGPQSQRAWFSTKGQGLEFSQAPVAHTCNPSYLGGRDQEASGSWDPTLKKSITKKSWRSGSRCRPWVQIPNTAKQTNKQTNKKKTLEPECLITSPGEADARNTWSSTERCWLRYIPRVMMGIMVHGCNPSTWEAEAKGSQIGGQPGLCSEIPPQKWKKE